MVMTQRTVRRFLQLFTFQEFNAPHPRRRTQMIHDGIGFVKSLRRYDVFVGDAFVLVGRRCAVAMKPNVMFSWNLTKSLIKRHKCELEIVIDGTDNKRITLTQRERWFLLPRGEG